MATPKQRMLKIAKRVLRERGPLPASSIAEVINQETRDGIHPSALPRLFQDDNKREIVAVPKEFDSKVKEYMIKENVEAGEPSGPN